jgi:type II secretory pathway pseudopilin PulG
MSTAVKEKKPFLPQRKTAAPKGLAVVGTPTPTVRSSLPSGALTIGGEPRVHLLPPEVTARKKLGLIKRRLLMVAIAVVAIAAVAYGVAVVSLTTAQGQLQDARTATAQLLVQQATYGEVSKVQNDINAIKAAQKTATAKEILWAPYISQVQASLPAGAEIQSFTGGLNVTSTSTIATPAVPLQASHIASITMTASMPQADIAGWLNVLPKIKGFIQVTPGSVAVNPKGGYIVGVTILMDSHALSNRFVKAVKN